MRLNPRVMDFELIRFMANKRHHDGIGHASIFEERNRRMTQNMPEI
jgi:hypothetical protein